VLEVVRWLIVQRKAKELALKRSLTSVTSATNAINIVGLYSTIKEYTQEYMLLNATLVARDFSTNITSGNMKEYIQERSLINVTTATRPSPRGEA